MENGYTDGVQVDLIRLSVSHPLSTRYELEYLCNVLRLVASDGAHHASQRDAAFAPQRNVVQVGVSEDAHGIDKGAL
jgi:hypothetical protein